MPHISTESIIMVLCHFPVVMVLRCVTPVLGVCCVGHKNIDVVLHCLFLPFLVSQLTTMLKRPRHCLNSLFLSSHSSSFWSSHCPDSYYVCITSQSCCLASSHLSDLGPSWRPLFPPSYWGRDPFGTQRERPRQPLET